MPKTTRDGKAKQSELPGTLKRSPAKAQRTFANCRAAGAGPLGATAGPPVAGLPAPARAIPDHSPSAGEALAQLLLALLGALAALALSTAEELRELVVAVALGVLCVRLEP